MPGNSSSMGTDGATGGGSQMPLAMVVGVLGAVYLITGRLGLEVAVPPGYATVIWPPAGVALAAVLIRGYVVLPGVFLGAVALELSGHLGVGEPHPLGLCLTVGAVNGAAACLQAGAGAYFLRRFGGFPNALDNAASVARMLIHGGALPSLISAAANAATLFLTGHIPAAELGVVAATLWAGGVMGVSIFTPAVLAWLGPLSHQWRRRRGAVTLWPGLSFLTALLLVAYATSLERANYKTELEELRDALHSRMDMTLAHYSDALQAIASFEASAEGSRPRAEFDVFARQTRSRVLGMQALSWVPRVRREDRAAFEAMVRQDGVPNFEIAAIVDDRPVRAPDQPEFFPVTMSVSPAVRPQALGFDLGSDQARRAAMDAARDTGELAATRNLRLVTGQNGVLAFVPVYRQDAPHETVEQRRAALKGFAQGVFRPSSLVTEAFGNLDLAEIHYWLVDATEGAPEEVLAADLEERPSDFVLADHGLFGGRVVLGDSFTIGMGDRRWIMRVSPTELFIAHFRLHNTWIVLVGGLLFTLLVGVSVMVVSGRELALQREVEVRGAAELALRSSRERLERITDSLFEGVLMINRVGRIVFANPSARRLLGWRSGDPAIEGRSIDEVLRLRSRDGELLFDDSPWRRVVDEGSTWVDDDASFVTSSGKVLSVAYACAPLPDGQKRRAAIVSFRDIAALKAAQREAIQASQLATIGQLAAGIAHEINTPIQYIGDNLNFIEEALGKFNEALDAVRRFIADAAGHPELAARAAAFEEGLATADVPYLVEESQVAARQSLEGVNHIARIVQSMKEFSHPGSSGKTLNDINAALENTLTVSRNEWKHVAEVERRLDPDLPLVMCNGGEVNQVFLNLIVNAAHAIRSSDKKRPGRIVVSTHRHEDWVEIRVADTGTGIPEAIKDKIFDPFFTTKEVGKGTGQGLAICRNVVVNKHGGSITLRGKEGEGAEFIVRLPLATTELRREEAAEW